MENPENQIIGAIKIKDGLFIGDEFASQDLEFIVTNKVTHIINCASKEIANSWESIGVSYLSFPWSETDDQIIFDEKNEIIHEIFRFIEETTTTGESCLVHSVRGQSRSCCVLAAYFMRKYRWSLYKTLEYLNSRRPDLEIRASFFHQLNDLEARLSRSGFGAKTSNWNETNENSLMDGEEIVIRNTFLNSKNMPLAEIYMNQNFYMNKEVKPKINWVDENSKNARGLALFFPERQENSNKFKNSNCVRSILKGSNRVFSKDSKQPLAENERKGPIIFGPYLKMNKSSKSLIEENNLKNSSMEEKKPNTPHNAPIIWSKPPTSGKDYPNRSLVQEQLKVEPINSSKDINVRPALSNMSRSNSLKVLNKEDSMTENTEKPETQSKYKEILRSNRQNEVFIPNGNSVIHVTVNNFVNSPTITNTINKYNASGKTNNINAEGGNEEKNGTKENFNYAQFKERKQLGRSSSKNHEEENNKKVDSYENYFNYSKPVVKLETNKEKFNESGNGSGLIDFKDNKKKILSRREHDSVSPIPVRGKSGNNPSPPKDSKDKKPKIMSESVYSKTLLKRFQNSLQQEKSYENTYMKVLKDQRGLVNRSNDMDNDVSPMRKVYDRSFNTRTKTSDSSIIEQNNSVSNSFNARNQPNNNHQQHSYNLKNSGAQNRIPPNMNNARKTISPLQNNMNVNNLIQSVTSYQISTKNNTTMVSNNSNTASNNVINNNNNNNNSNNNNPQIMKNGPIRATYERKELQSMVPSKQISISNNPNDSTLVNLHEYKGKSNNGDYSILNRPGSAPFRYYSPNSKLVVKSVQRSITPLAVPNEQPPQQNNQAKPRLRSSSPSTNNTNMMQNSNNNNNNTSINSSFQSNLFVYGYNSTAFQSKPKWKF